MSSGIIKPKVLDLTSLSYSKPAYNYDTSELIRNAETQLYGHKVEFDSMVGIGLSGLLVLPLLARHFKVPFFACRKGEESHHNNNLPEGGGRIGQRWLMVDDGKVTGATITKVRGIISRVAQRYDFDTEYVGCYSYNGYINSPGFFEGPEEYAMPTSLQQFEIDGVVHYVPSDMFYRIRTILEKHFEENPSTAVSATMDYFRKVNFRGWDESLVAEVVASIYGSTVDGTQYYC
jgi:hypothetical protein